MQNTMYVGSACTHSFQCMQEDIFLSCGLFFKADVVSFKNI